MAATPQHEKRLTPEEEALVKQARKVLPSPEEWHRYDEDQKWLDRQRSKLVKQYPDTWVAVYKKQVVATHPNLEELLKEVRRKKVKTSDAVIGSLATDEVLMLL